MIRVDRFKLIYIDPLKTGSQSLDKFWKYHGGMYLKNSPNSKADKHRRHLNESRYENWRLCASVRNPYTRAYSLWNMDVKKKINPHNIRLNDFQDYMEDIVNLCSKYPDSDDIRVYRYYSCSQYLKPFDIPDNHIIHMENMKADIQSMGFAPKDIVVRNRGRYKQPWKDVSNELLMGLINVWAYGDFEKYGYERHD